MVLQSVFEELSVFDRGLSTSLTLGALSKFDQASTTAADDLFAGQPVPPDWLDGLDAFNADDL